jgi:hypothetical protein
MGNKDENARARGMRRMSEESCHGRHRYQAPCLLLNGDDDGVVHDPLRIILSWLADDSAG